MSIELGESGYFANIDGVTSSGPLKNLFGRIEFHLGLENARIEPRVFQIPVVDGKVDSRHILDYPRIGDDFQKVPREPEALKDWIAEARRITGSDRPWEPGYAGVLVELSVLLWRLATLEGTLHVCDLFSKLHPSQLPAAWRAVLDVLVINPAVRLVATVNRPDVLDVSRMRTAAPENIFMHCKKDGTFFSCSAKDLDLLHESGTHDLFAVPHDIAKKIPRAERSFPHEDQPWVAAVHEGDRLAQMQFREYCADFDRILNQKTKMLASHEKRILELIEDRKELAQKCENLEARLPGHPPHDISAFYDEDAG